jgi:predicted TIM-barrel fold metal-dependent hydrolase
MSPRGAFETLGLGGSPLAGELVIDAHMHIGSYHNFPVPRGRLTNLLERARRIGISKMYGSSLMAIRGDSTAGNASAIETHLASNGVFFPYFVAKPNYPEDIRAVIDLSESTRQRRFKIHDDGNDLPYDHRNYGPLYEHADATGAVILVHTYGLKHVRPMMGVAERFPRIQFLLAHSGIADEEVYREAAKRHPNIYLETCCSLAWYGLMERLVDMAGADRVIFGTDMPFMSPDQQIGRVLFARLADEAKRKILGLNAARVLGAG